MGDGGSSGREGSSMPPVAGLVDERDLDTPNCPDCLMRMEAEESATGKPYWGCTECGRVLLA